MVDWDLPSGRSQNDVSGLSSNPSAAGCWRGGEGAGRDLWARRDRIRALSL